MDRKGTTGETIKHLRIRKGITQKSLAKQTGISLSAIIAYENNKREPNAKNMAILEQFFGVSGAYLRGEASMRNHIDALNPSLAFFQPAVIQRMISSIQQDNRQNQEQLRQMLIDLETITSIEDEAVRTGLLEMAALNLHTITSCIQQLTK